MISITDGRTGASQALRSHIDTDLQLSDTRARIRVQRRPKSHEQRDRVNQQEGPKLKRGKKGRTRRTARDWRGSLKKKEDEREAWLEDVQKQFHQTHILGYIVGTKSDKITYYVFKRPW